MWFIFIEHYSCCNILILSVCLSFHPLFCYFILHLSHTHTTHTHTHTTLLNLSVSHLYLLTSFSNLFCVFAYFNNFTPLYFPLPSCPQDWLYSVTNGSPLTSPEKQWRELKMSAVWEAVNMPRTLDRWLILWDRRVTSVWTTSILALFTWREQR